MSNAKKFSLIVRRIFAAMLLAGLLLGGFVNSPASAESPTPLSGVVAQETLVPKDAGVSDDFGYSVAISGDTAVVGAPYEDPTDGDDLLSNAGAAYVFVQQGNQWVQQAKLVAKDAEAGDNFGISVDIYGSTIAVGAVGKEVDNGGDELDENVGAVYIFTRTGDTWDQQAKLVGAAEDDNFGVSVALSGSTLVVGADFHDPLGIPDTGKAYVFIGKFNYWYEQAQLMPQFPSVGDHFGHAVDIDGDTIVVGATKSGNPFSQEVGEAFIFSRTGTNWNMDARLEPEDGRVGDFFGHSVSIDRGTVAVGALLSDPNLGSGLITSAGSVYIFTDRNNWSQTNKIVLDDASPFDYFGNDVELEGDTLIVGANGKDSPGSFRSGRAYVYQQSGTVWSPLTYLFPEYADDDDEFGQAVAMEGNTFLVGANGRDPGYLTGAGEAFVFELGQSLPATGFAPNEVTSLPEQSAAQSYSNMGDLWMEVPQLSVQLPIVSVPQNATSWDTTWLWDKAGYLEGTAFPTMEGNTAIAAHVYLPDGSPGPFLDLGTLKWGDRILVHAWGQIMVYEVREISTVAPDDMRVLAHEDYDWVTLITCKEFDEANNVYKQRTVVKAVLIAVQD
ncbi:MAG: sortase [Anaerolineales bacterium]|nr:sortase [Anaerolineales bacterium]